jgi:cytochrome b561
MARGEWRLGSLAQAAQHIAMADRYTRTAIALHWLVALGVLAQVAFGWQLDDLPRDTPEHAAWIRLHKQAGVALLVLILVRMHWRLTHRPPPLPASVPPWQRRAASASHALLYACMLGMPLAGILGTNVEGFGMSLHVWISYLFVLLILLHVAAAARHLVARDGVFGRIISSRGS